MSESILMLIERRGRVDLLIFVTLAVLTLVLIWVLLIWVKGIL